MSARVAAAALAAFLATASAPAQVVQYVVTAIDYPPGTWTSSIPASVNNAGQATGYVIGNSPSAPGYRAWRYTPGVGTVDLGSLGPADSNSRGSAINAAGQVVGYTNVAAGMTGGAYRFTTGVGMVNLGTLSGDNFSQAFGINNAGQVVGVSAIAGGTTAQAFRYTDGIGMVGLGVPAGMVGSTGRAINNVGQVVITTATPTQAVRSFRYSDATGHVPLGTLGGTNVTAVAINDVGQVVGNADTPSGARHAFRYSDGVGIVDLGVLPGEPTSDAMGINALGVVVGNSSTLTTGGAFLYRDDVGMVNLNTLIDPTTGWVLLSANAISDNGLIVGQGRLNGVAQPFLLTPIPEPSALALAGLAAACGLAHCWRRGRGRVVDPTTSEATP
ncbi:MAG: PEP-CTERM sorting domain-containing protein [Gemmataceae bacterium]